MFRNLIPLLAVKYHVIAPDYPGYGHSSMPPHDKFEYTFDHLAQVIDDFTDKVGTTKYTIYVQDYGAPVGYRLAAKHPDRITGIVVQNGNAYDEGLDNDFWKPIQRNIGRSPKAKKSATQFATCLLTMQRNGSTQKALSILNSSARMAQLTTSFCSTVLAMMKSNSTCSSATAAIRPSIRVGRSISANTSRQC